jgi:hypothetical protein
MGMKVVASLVLALTVMTGVAAACPPGRPCLKYQRREITVVETPIGYRRVTAKAIPRWSRDGIARFLANSVWEPIVVAKKVDPNVPVAARSPIIHYMMPPKIRLVPADLAATTVLDGGEALVLQRRIEKQGRAILVEVDANVFELRPCAKNRAFACLVQTSLTLSPVEETTAGFAQPPPP